jgi:hypothetical protein
MKHLFICAVLALALIGTASAACCGSGGISATIFPFNPSGCPELPRLPHTFGGCVYINGDPAPDGTRVCVAGNGVAGNCIGTNTAGCFGMGTFDEKLSATGIPVPGVGMINVQEGTPLSFYVNGERARVCIGSSCQWTTQYHTGHHTFVSLYLTVPEGCCQTP